jgi:MraZ protein
VRHPVLTGEYELSCDEKRRILVPIEVRRAVPLEFGESFYCMRGINRVWWLYPEKVYETLVMQAPTEMVPSEDSLAFDQMVFGMTSRLPWDKQGRILLPDRMFRDESMGRELTLVGVRDHLELWGRAAWEARREELEARALEVFAKGKQARQTPPVQPIAAPAVQ